MIPSDNIAAAIHGTHKTITRINAILKSFNEPDWPDRIHHIIKVTTEFANLHGEGARPSFADDYGNLVSLLSQIAWPYGEIEGDYDDRLERLRGAIGELRLDIDQIHQAGASIGIRPTMSTDGPAIETMLSPKAGNERNLDAMIKRLESIETLLGGDIVPESRPANKLAQINVVKYYANVMYSNISLVRGVVAVGDYFDLGTIERASVMMAEATRQMLQTVHAVGSKATATLRTAIDRMKMPMRRFISGVKTLARRIHRTKRPEQTEILPNISDPSVSPELHEPKVGQVLKKSREAQGLTIMDVANRTRISTRHLEALEEGRYNTLVSSTYVFGFIRNYAKAIGENEIVIMQQLRAEWTGGHQYGPTNWDDWDQP